LFAKNNTLSSLVGKNLSKVIGQIRGFFNRQTKNFKVLFLTSVLTQSIRRITAGTAGAGGGGAAGGASYEQLYLRALGANPQQLGVLNSVGRFANTVVSLPLGWISDRVSLKKVVIFGLILSVIVPTAFALSTNWNQAMPAVMMNTITITLTGMFTVLFLVTSVRESTDRATVMSMRTTLISIAGLIIPTISAIIVLNFGGISVEGIRPLFIISIIANILILMYALWRLKEVSFLQKQDSVKKKRNIFQDYKEIAKIPTVLKWTLTKGVRSFFANSLLSFYSLYYVEVKGADPIIIGAMATIGTLGSLIFLVPLGRIADKYGRKRAIYLTRPGNYLSTLIVIFAPSPQYLILAAFLGAFSTIGFLMEITMEHELVPGEQRGRLAGFNSFVWGVSGIPGPLLMGFLWDRVNPAYLLLLPILTDIPFTLILRTIPDTLHRVYEKDESM